MQKWYFRSPLHSKHPTWNSKSELLNEWLRWECWGVGESSCRTYCASKLGDTETDRWTLAPVVTSASILTHVTWVLGAREHIALPHADRRLEGGGCKAPGPVWEAVKSKNPGCVWGGWGGGYCLSPSLSVRSGPLSFPGPSRGEPTSHMLPGVSPTARAQRCQSKSIL